MDRNGSYARCFVSRVWSAWFEPAVSMMWQLCDMLGDGLSKHSPFSRCSPIFSLFLKALSDAAPTSEVNAHSYRVLLSLLSLFRRSFFDIIMMGLVQS